jgi:pyruvate carboxylase
MPTPIRKLLVANRSEIAIRVFRSAHELGIRTVAIYSYEDRFALHRFKADEAYQIGAPGEPIRAYLDIPGILAIARQYEIDAIHPGYGFLSENPGFARACREAGLVFIGPHSNSLDQFGDKLAARRIAEQAGVPVLPGSGGPVAAGAEAQRIAEKLGYPVIVKAAMGGGGRGMRVAVSAERLAEAVEQASREAQSAFGIADVFLEKYIARAKHIEVQLLGDSHGNLVHIFERDCSLQRRHQKVVEIAPAINLDATVRRNILDAALSLGRAVRFDNAGTVEFLLDADCGRFYFIEVNPRIQVEHTVTEAITGIDLVKSQILIAQGASLSDAEIGLPNQDSIAPLGQALQCRITTEDPANQFKPDYGRLSHYRSASGMGIRLDAGTAFSGAVISPYYDSLLVKVTAHGRRFLDAARRMERCLQEFRVRGVKTNIPFLINLVTHPRFLDGTFTTKFIDETPELFQFPLRQDRATKLLTFIGDVIVNGNPEMKRGPGAPVRIPRERAPLPVTSVAGRASDGQISELSPSLARPANGPAGTRDRFRALGPEAFARWVREQPRLFITDTTFRDAHQSLLATRMRTYDMRQIAPAYAQLLSGLFSLEMWGGATFDTAMRFLKESPWQRLAELREQIPNILFQMLLRAANAVGYTNYPDNLVRAFVKEAAAAGIDLFRIFDALNWEPNLQLAIEAVRDTGMLCEAAICYTGDILNPARSKYDLKYYVTLAKRLEKLGANLLAIKDMAGLCKPYAARLLVRALRQEVGIPIHFHTHDSAGVQAAAYVLAADEGVDIVDCATAPFSGMTSQPNLNSVVEAMRFTPRDTGIAFEPLQAVAEYWEVVRRYYAPFESGQLASSADVYLHEMPGGQYTNLFQQAQSMGLAPRWHEVCRMYAEVNKLFGDIVKVTPTSKVVGDMALFMVGNNLTADDVRGGQRALAYPESVLEFFEGRLGQPPGGFDPALQPRILGNRPAYQDRPGARLPAADFDAAKRELEVKLQRSINVQEVVSYLLYPKVFLDFAEHQRKYADVSVLPTWVFFQGMEPGEEVGVDIEQGKTLIIKFQTVSDPHPDGRRQVFFELNGQPREVPVLDSALAKEIRQRPKADPQDPAQVGAPMPGLVATVMVAGGDPVEKGQKLFTLEAMKMETTVYAERSGQVAEVAVERGVQVEAGDLLLRFA